MKNVIMVFLCLITTLGQLSASNEQPIGLVEFSADARVEVLTFAGDMALMEVKHDSHNDSWRLFVEVDGDMAVSDMAITPDHVVIAGSFTGDMILDGTTLSAGDQSEAFYLAFSRSTGQLELTEQVKGEDPTYGRGLIQTNNGLSLLAENEAGIFTVSVEPNNTPNPQEGIQMDTTAFRANALSSPSGTNPDEDLSSLTHTSGSPVDPSGEADPNEEGSTTANTEG